MRTTLAGLLLAAITIPATLPEVNEVYSSSYAPCWATLPTPAQLLPLGRDGSDPAKPGTYSLAVSLVDVHGAVGPMSPTTTFTTVLTNWNLRIRPAKVPVNTNACSWLLWFKRCDPDPTEPAEQYEWRPYNGDAVHVVRPYLPLTGLDDHATRSLNIARANRGYPNMQWKPYEDAYWPKSQNVPAPGAPSVEVLHVPNARLGLRFAWAGNDGESLASEPLYIDATEGLPAAAHSPVRVGRTPVPPANGALGMHVYCSIDEGATWHRQAAPHFAGDMPATKDEWLWPVAMQQFTLNHFRATGVAPAETAGRSWLSSRNRAVYESTKSVVMDSHDPITCPIISPHLVDGVSADHRTFAAKLQQRWNLTTATSTPDGVTGFPTMWPMWVETAQRSRLVGCYMQSATASVGVEMLAYMASSNFHFRSERLFIVLYSDFQRPDPYTCGIRSLADARAVGNNHSPSEPIFSDTEILARHPLVVEFGQSANWQTHNITAQSYTHGEDYSKDCEPAVFSVNNSGNFKATGRTTTDGGRAVLACLAARQVKIDEWFSDQGHYTWVVFSGNGGAEVQITAAASNHQHKQFLHVAEVAPAKQSCNTLIVQGNSGNLGYFDSVWNWRTDIKARIFTGGRYCGVRYKLARMPLLNLFETPSPSWAEWQTSTYTENTGSSAHYYQKWDAGLDAAGVIKRDMVLGVKE